MRWLPLLLLAACGTSGTTEAPRQHLPKPTDPSLTVLVSNQSFDEPTVDVTIEIDGKKAITGEFDVEGQHTWVPFDFDLGEGNHTMSIRTSDGITLEKTFVMDDRKWIVVSYWYYAAGSPEPTPKQFSFQLHDEAPLFD